MEAARFWAYRRDFLDMTEFEDKAQRAKLLQNTAPKLNCSSCRKFVKCLKMVTVEESESPWSSFALREAPDPGLGTPTA